MITDVIVLIYSTGLLLGVISGFFMHRSDYCVTAMFRDAILFRNTFLLRALILQIVFSMVIFEIARLLGFLPLYPFPLLGTPSLANLIGGFVFGLGMVLAGGCVVGTLYKIGAGSLLSVIAFVGLIIGSGIYAEVHPWWADFMKQTSFLHGVKTIPELVQINPSIAVSIVVVSVLPLFLKWHREKKWERHSLVIGYIQPWKTGIVLSFIGLLSYLLMGMPLGITTTYAKMAAMIENIFSPEHVSKVAFFQAMPLNLVHPSTGALLQGGAGPNIDAVWAIQFPVIIGIVLGSAISAILLKEFAIRWHVPPYQFVLTLCGGIILGLGSRLVPGCNVWHLMSGLPILAIQSILFLVGLLPGAFVGGKIIVYLIHKHSSQI